MDTNLVIVIIDGGRLGARALCDHVTPTKNEKWWSKGVAMYPFDVSRYRKSIKWTWAELLELNVMVERVLKFVAENESWLFFDAYTAKTKV